MPISIMPATHAVTNPARMLAQWAKGGEGVPWFRKYDSLLSLHLGAATCHSPSAPHVWFTHAN